MANIVTNKNWKKITFDPIEEEAQQVTQDEILAENRIGEEFIHIPRDNEEVTVPNVLLEQDNEAIFDEIVQEQEEF